MTPDGSSPGAPGSTPPPEAAQATETGENVEAAAEGEDDGEKKENKPQSLTPEQRAKIEATCNKEEVMDFFIDEFIKEDSFEVSPEICEALKKIMAEKYPDDKELSANLDQFFEACKKIPQLFPNIKAKIAELKDQPEYMLIENRAKEVIKAILEAVYNGHLTATDASECVAKVEIKTKSEYASEKGATDAASGYEGIMFFEIRERRIVIIQESLVDDFRNPDGSLTDLNIRHLVRHEMAHSVVIEALFQDQGLQTEAIKIIQNVEQSLPFQTQHIKNVLAGIKPFERSFDQLSDAEKAKYKDNASYEREKQKAQIRAMNEIMTDYTAIYLKTDGSYEDFVFSCLENVCQNQKDADAFFAAIGINDPQKQEGMYHELADAETKEEKAKLLEKNPALKKAAEDYKAFWKHIKEGISDSKDSIGREREEGELEYLDDVYPGGLIQEEAPKGSAPDQKTSKESESLIKQIGGLMAAMGNDLTGGGGTGQAAPSL